MKMLIRRNPEHWIDNQFWRTRLLWRHSGKLHEHETWIAGYGKPTNLLGAWWLSRQGPYRGRVGGPSLVVRRDDRWNKPTWGLVLPLSPVHNLLRWFTAEDFSRDIQCSGLRTLLK